MSLLIKAETVTLIEKRLLGLGHWENRPVLINLLREGRQRRLRCGLIVLEVLALLILFETDHYLVLQVIQPALAAKNTRHASYCAR